MVDRCLSLSADETRDALDRLRGYEDRHRDLRRVLEDHFATVAGRVDVDLEADGELSVDQRALIGAAFTQEFAIEAAALFNPSIVAHPEPDPDPARLRFIMSARAVGEGHVSSIVFCTGVVADADGEPCVVIDPRSPYATRGTVRPQAGDAYETEFDLATELSERTLLPAAGPESRGLEDARFVRFTEEDGSSTYLATYTAFDGSHITPTRLQTDDFRRFHVTPFAGYAATNKGMALFPRRVGGRYLALSRWDRENNEIAWSSDGHDWNEAVAVQLPGRSWDLVQLGNCGSPIETERGWLVLTHGVGPMREYAIGALLLDLDDPSKVLGELSEPLLRPEADERDGYVPNVVYSCGALRYRETLVLPYGCSDSSIRLAFVDLPQLLEQLQS